MNGFELSPVVWIWISVQAMGFVSAFIARISEGSSHQTISHLFFYACLALVGATAIVALSVGPGCWLASAITLSAMVLIVTCDFSRSGPMVAD
jgi:hypothetical protein